MEAWSWTNRICAHFPHYRYPPFYRPWCRVSIHATCLHPTVYNRCAVFINHLCSMCNKEVKVSMRLRPRICACVLDKCHGNLWLCMVNVQIFSTTARDGNVFRSVCHSVHGEREEDRHVKGETASKGEGVCIGKAWVCIWRGEREVCIRGVYPIPTTPNVA